jgi:hypothetical protein
MVNQFGLRSLRLQALIRNSQLVMLEHNYIILKQVSIQNAPYSTLIRIRLDCYPSCRGILPRVLYNAQNAPSPFLS